MKTVAALANAAWLAASFPAWRRFRYALNHPEETQLGMLRRLLAENAMSAYGRAHGFHEIRSYEEFCGRVPAVGYEDLEPWIKRIMRGENSVLTQEMVTRLLPTSGSTGARKLIPFTAGLQREFNAAIGPWIFDLCRQHSSIPLGPSYWSISPAMPASELEISAVPIGFDDDSAFLGGVRQRLVETTFAAPSALRLISDIECNRYFTLLCLLREPELRFISVWHPSFLTLLLDALPVWWDELLQDVEHGDSRRIAALPAGLRRALRARPQRKRARELRKMNPVNAHEIWPRLRVVSCWGDGQAGLALAALQTRLAHAVIQPKGLLATEAVVSIPFEGSRPLAITSHFFEFLDESGRVRMAHELHSGASYTVVATTAGGLWRYRIGDMVEVDGVIGRTPSLRFIGRGASVSDVCGEKLAEAFVTRAIEDACKSSAFAPDFAMLTPEKDAARQWNYTLFIEGKPPDDFLLNLEGELRKNPHYALCRDLGQLGPLRCFQIASGGYETFCKVSLTQSQRLGDIKPQMLSSRTDWRQYFTGMSLADFLVPG